MSMNGPITIGRVAKAAGVSIDTVRFYERRGLVSPSARRASGYRVYREDAVRRLTFIRRAQELGFSLKEIAALLRLRSGGGVRCDRVRVAAGRHLEDVRARVRALKRIEAVLDELVRTCERNGATDGCPILQSLENGAGVVSKGDPHT